MTLGSQLLLGSVPFINQGSVNMQPGSNMTGSVFNQTAPSSSVCLTGSASMAFTGAVNILAGTLCGTGTVASGGGVFIGPAATVQPSLQGNNSVLTIVGACRLGGQ